MVYGGYKYLELDYVPDRKNDLVTFLWASGQYDIEKLAEGLAAESSVGTWTEIKTINDRVFSSYRAKVFKLVKTSQTSGFVWIAYPMDHFEEDNLLQILASIRGNVFSLEELTSLKFLDISMPSRLQRHYPGPGKGLEGVRRRAGTLESGRPHSGTIVKPKVGLAPGEWAEVAKNSYLGGLDFVKDDENLVNQPFCRWEERVDAMMEVIDEMKDQTGRRVMYSPNITAPYGKMMERLDYLDSIGWDIVMLDVYFIGYSALEDIIRDIQRRGMIIHAHRAGHTAETRGAFGVEYHVHAKLWRLLGVDQLHTGTGVGKMEGPPLFIRRYGQEMTSQHIEEALHLLSLDFDWDDHIKPLMPVASGGLDAGRVDALGEIYGRDFVAQAGGGIHGHPGGTTAGAKSLRDAVDALAEGVPAPVKAESSPELKAALDLWGYVDPAGVRGVLDMVDSNKDIFRSLLFTMGYEAFGILERLRK